MGDIFEYAIGIASASFIDAIANCSIYGDLHYLLWRTQRFVCVGGMLGIDFRRDTPEEGGEMNNAHTSNRPDIFCPKFSVGRGSNARTRYLR